MKTIDDLLRMLAEKGGVIVSSAQCNVMQIADARAQGRMAVDNDGLGYIWYREAPSKANRPDTPGHKALVFLQRTEARLMRHQEQLGRCRQFPFASCPECSGEDLRQDLLALYSRPAA